MGLALRAAWPNVNVSYRFYYHFNNLRFKQDTNINDLSAAHVAISFVSSEHVKCRLLTLLLTTL